MQTETQLTPGPRPCAWVVEAWSPLGSFIEAVVYSNEEAARNKAHFYRVDGQGRLGVSVRAVAPGQPVGVNTLNGF